LVQSNKISDISPLFDIETLIEIDLSFNLVQDSTQLSVLIQNKKELLVVDLQANPVTATAKNLGELFADEPAPMTYFQGGVLYKN